MSQKISGLLDRQDIATLMVEYSEMTSYKITERCIGINEDEM